MKFKYKFSKFIKAILLLAIVLLLIGLTLWGIQFAVDLFNDSKDTFNAILILTSSIIFICVSGWFLTGLINKIKQLF